MRVLLALGALVLCLAGPARAQHGPIDGHGWLAPEWLAQLDPAMAGRRVYTEGRWHECWRDGVSLAGVEASRRALRVPMGEELQKALSRNMDGKLRKGVSNVRVFGTARRQGEATVVEVSRVDLLEDDAVRFRRLLEELGQRPQVAAIARLVADAAALAERYSDEALEEVVRELRARELEVRMGQLRPDDFASAMTLGQRLVEASDRPGAISVYGSIEARGPDALRAQARQKLAELRAVRSTSGWVPFEEFKVQEGFMNRPEGGTERWVTKEQAELEDTIKAVLALFEKQGVVIFRSNAQQCGVNAQQRLLVKGQTLEEARLAAGQPVSVAHQRGLGAAGEPLLWTQWVWADGRRAYFMAPAPTGDAPPPSAELVLLRTAKDAWPAK